MTSRSSLSLRYALGDLARRGGVTVALSAVLVLSAFLMATGAMVIERLVGSVDQLFAQARPPHFLQLHEGDYDAAALQAFAARHAGIDAWTIVELHGFDGAALAWERPSTGEAGDLSASLIDNLFVAQNADFDLLIDEAGEVADPAHGEVYVPVAYQQRFGLRAGDELGVRTDAGIHELTVRGFVRDAQMATSLSSSTRFVVSPTDLRALGAAGGSDAEIIVEYLLADPADAADLQRAYEADDALPRNGQAVTGDMIRLINAFSDGLVGVALMFSSLLLIAIALLSLRFVIRGALQDGIREIGMLKAIGVPDAHIARLHLWTYRTITLAACVVGGVLAIGATQLLTRDVAANYATAPPTVWTFAVPVAALGLVYVMVVTICRGVLRRIRRIEVVRALVHGSTLTERQAARAARRQARRVRRTSLATYRGSAIGRRLAVLDLRAEASEWMLLPIVFFLAAILMMLPLNLLSTFESPRFVTYLGAPESDLRIDLRFSGGLDAVHADLVAALRHDARIADVRAYADVLAQVDGPAGVETLRIEVGDYSAGTVDFVAGGPPADGQLALSVLNAEELRAAPGDQLRIRAGDGWSVHAVSGVYQDVTSGGHTAKLQGGLPVTAVGHVIYAHVTDGADPGALASEYGARFRSASAIPMREYVQQTLAHVTGGLRQAAVLAFAFGVGIPLLITSLFLGLRLSRDRRTMGALSAIGFSTREIVAQVRGKTLLTVVVGTLLGLAFTVTLGESLTGTLLSSAGLGIAELSFVPVPWLVYGLYPLALVGAGGLAAVLVTARLHRADTSTWLA